MFCQKCRTPLRPDSSLEDLNPAALNLLIEASSRTLKGNIPSSRMLYTPEQKERYDEAAKISPDPIVKQSFTKNLDSVEDGKSSHSLPNPAMSFVMLTDSQMGPSPSKGDTGKRGSSNNKSRRKASNKSDNGGPLSQQMESTARLFEILSARSDIDHPICVECTDLLIEGMEKRLANATKERDAYAEYLKNANADAATEEERQQVEAEIKAVRERESNALAELEALEVEKLKLEEELAALDREAREVDREEEEFWKERNAFSQVLSDYQGERDSLNLRYDHDSRQLEKLQRTNVYNDTFNITYDRDGFGTINALRLGRGSGGKTVEWAEVNAAWGQTMLLLKVVAEKLDYTFVGHQLNPMGSTSTIDKWDTPISSTAQGSPRDEKQNVVSLQLSYSSDMPLSIGFLHRHIDAAMVAFLECVRQVGDHISRTAKGERRSLPYAIKKDKIGDVSIKLGSFTGDEGWTRACKLILINCKFCLAYAANVDARKS